ncbi:MAG TPA: hypothetical protein VJ904_00425, partial [Tichowtungia sp.]|nr:hypothetical protein [Tichowtungia sp.]
MKIKWILMLTAALAVTASADIQFLGGLVGTNTSWAGGVLPTTAGNPGVITNGVTGEVGNNSKNSAETSVVGLFIRQEGGNISSTSYRGSEFDSTTWTVDGGKLGTSNGQNWQNGSVLTVNSGGALETAGGRDLSINASTFTINGGTVTVGGGFVVPGNPTFTMNGGTFTISDEFGGGFSGGGTFTLNSGTITAGKEIGGKFGNLDINFGTGVGSLTVASVRSDVNSIVYDFAVGSGWSYTITGATEWAEAEWNDGNLLYNGQGTNDLNKTWAEVTAAGGLGNGENFSYNSTTETLTVVPEPATLGMVAF